MLATLSDALMFLLARRQQPARGILIVAALPCVIFALAGWEYGAFPLYAILASICLIQALWPTLLAWAVVVVIYTVSSVVYLYLGAQDVIGLARGRQASVFLNSGDDEAFLLLLVILLAVDIGLVLHRPKPLVAA
ncbi:MAG: hypothetical protein ABSH37_17345 [Bryobacteraceae bacterium]|jgi:hypothetical protein